ncbi:MAG: twin-arginine translocase TatA/TatE family subunit [Kiritimatiellae bacterium]|nr:twin-arginine translocase TatA/TatE family subunit [Kiritimatiellia bacterium]
MKVGIWQLLIVILLIVLIFGAKKIPEIARALGRSSGEFKKGLKEGNAEATAKVDEIKEAILGDPDQKA